MEHTYENCHNLTCRLKERYFGYNQALEDFEKCIIQQSEEGWSGMTIDTNTLKGIKEQLKR